MEKVVADASVIVKWFVDEVYSKNARKLRDEYINGSVEIISPELMPYEVLNALKHKGLFNKEEIVTAARVITLYGFRLYPLTGKLAERTAEIAVENDLTIYDASYIALAEEQKAKLYTADEKLIEKAKFDFVMHIREFV
ncbi:PilT protein domain protein [Ferroglobus placidus DSM 10642]|uniref:PilT protein domain protein n=1 Tax=Ferroglobus placidus (strain DSM 10642 / AEDII12DO) TaxID=589924 RepID=D3RZY2_FERPA|nr:type II toxin-antitoxin system VapC family toxin [Ferroglobus placidus]ADC66045.1 PilT protein domain protein [Ferroglobus placidus DSM 10642]